MNNIMKSSTILQPIAGALAAVLATSVANATTIAKDTDIIENRYTVVSTWVTDSNKPHSDWGVLALAEAGHGMSYWANTTEGFVQVSASSGSALILKFDFSNTRYQATGFIFEAAVAQTAGPNNVTNYYSLDGGASWIHITDADATTFPSWPTLNKGVVNSFADGASSAQVWFKVSFDDIQSNKLRYGVEGSGITMPAGATLLSKEHGFAIQFTMAGTPSIPEPASVALVAGICIFPGLLLFRRLFR
jgi:hypothetical protein